MDKCHHAKCNTKFDIFNHKYKCGVCGKHFCDSHSCNSSYVSHMKGNGHYNIDKVVINGGYICQECFSDDVVNNEGLQRNIFGRECSEYECKVKLNSIIETKNSCISCGHHVCSLHSVSKKTVSRDWILKHTNYPLAEAVCKSCLSTKSASRDADSCYTHPLALNFKLVGGEPSGKRKAIVVHGILSNPLNLDWFSRGLIRKGLFDSVWLLDDISYQGRVNEAASLGLSDVPVGIDLKQIGKGAMKLLGRKAFQVVDLPNYIVEGTAKNLASTIKLLGWDDVTLIGHSLGGLVVRCAVEAFGLEENVEKVVTLGSPFRLWARANKTRIWSQCPADTVKYLAILGKDDLVAARRSLANLTSDDNNYNNILKVIFPGLDHTGVHEKADGSYMFDFLKCFLSGELFSSTKQFYLKKSDDKSYAYMSGLHGDPSDSSEPFSFSGNWIDFESI